MNRRSIAACLRHDIVGALLLSSLITFSLLYLMGRAQRVQDFERALQDDLRAIANITQSFPDDEVYVNIQPNGLIEFQAQGSRFFQLWDAHSPALLDQSPSLESLNFRFARPELVTAMPRRLEARLPDGTDVSLIVVQLLATWGLEEGVLQRLGTRLEDHHVQLMVGRSRQELEDSLLPLALACVAGALFLPLLAATVLMLRVPHALRPLSELRGEIERRGPDDVRPFTGYEVRELRPLISCLNQLIERIAGARHRERQFLAHAAHELRTPLTELQSTADVALLRPKDAKGHAQALEDMRAVTQRAARLVDALFRLARFGREGAPKVLQAVRLREPIAAAVNQAIPASRQRQLEWRLEGADDASVLTDPTLFRALLDNLVGNTIAHARMGTQVSVRWQGGDSAVVELCNQCGQEPPQGGDDAHLGHGLTVAQLYAFALNATLQTVDAGGQFLTRIHFSAHQN